MNIDILHRPTALENLLAGRIWPAGRRLPMHVLDSAWNLRYLFALSLIFQKNTCRRFYKNCDAITCCAMELVF